MYAINKSHGNLTLKSGFVQIGRGSFAKITDEDLELPDFKDAIAKGWMVVSETEPKGGMVETMKIEELATGNQAGMSEAEMQVELAKINTTNTPGTTTALGVETQVVSEPTTTKLGAGDGEVTEAEVSVEATPVEKKTRAKK